jgi:hypothetical protein
MRGGFAEAMRDVATSYVIPICWVTARNGKPLILAYTEPPSSNARCDERHTSSFLLSIN